MMLLSRLFREWFTNIGNKSFELGRALWALGVLALIAYQGMAIFLKGQAFSPLEFGTGLAAILAAGGFGVAAKDGAATAAKTADTAAKTGKIAP
jgi:hypothetical protein